MVTSSGVSEHRERLLRQYLASSPPIAIPSIRTGRAHDAAQSHLGFGEHPRRHVESPQAG